MASYDQNYSEADRAYKAPLGGLSQTDAPAMAAAIRACNILRKDSSVCATTLDVESFYKIYAACDAQVVGPDADDEDGAGEVPGDTYEELVEAASNKRDEREIELITMTSALCQFNFRAKELFKQLVMVHQTSSWESAPLVVTQVNDNIVTVTTWRTYKPYLALSHRWQAAAKTTSCTVQVVDDGKQITSWPVELDTNALKFAQHVTAQGIPLWLDHVCICQTSTSHKNAQIAFMGAIYAAATTVVVNEVYNTSPPPSLTYWSRTWTWQEYRYGSVVPLYWLPLKTMKTHVKHENITEKDKLWGGLNSMGDRLYDNDAWPPEDYRESWRPSALADIAAHLGSWYTSFYRLAWSVTNSNGGAGCMQSERTRKVMMVAALASRFDFGQLNHRLYFESLANMRKLESKFPKDRLYGIFGVVVSVMGGETLDYSDPIASLDKIRRLCHAPNVGFHRDDGDSLCSDLCALTLHEQIRAAPMTPEYDSELLFVEEQVRKRKPTRAKIAPVTLGDTMRGEHRHTQMLCNAFMDPNTGNIGFELAYGKAPQNNRRAHFVWIKGGKPHDHNEFAESVRVLGPQPTVATTWTFVFNVAHDLINASPMFGDAVVDVE